MIAVRGPGGRACFTPALGAKIAVLSPPFTPVPCQWQLSSFGHVIGNELGKRAGSGLSRLSARSAAATQRAEGGAGLAAWKTG
jgi:hypothetical protein